MEADEVDLYGDGVFERALPSVVELEGSLAVARAERIELERELARVQQDCRTTKAEAEDLTRRACTILSTARLEIRRKEEMLEAEARAHRRPDKKRARDPERRQPASDSPLHTELQ